MSTATTRKPRALNAVERSILADFNRKPIKARGEYSDGAGHVLVRNVDHYYARPLGTLTSRGLVDYFTRCGCECPCTCETNGWHITPAGVAELRSAS